MKILTFYRYIATLLFAFIFSLSQPVQANAFADTWSTSNESNTDMIDHNLWNDFLQRYIDTDSNNKVRYATVSATDKSQLEDYIQQLSLLNPLEYNKKEQFAYWVNMYNAVTIKVILDHYPVKSIRKIKLDGGLFAIGPWKSKVVTVNGQQLSLDNIEHDILRPIWQDPRIHYAVNCASIGCPKIASLAFTSENTEDLLEKNAREFINSDNGVLLDTNKLVVSKIYQWYSEDFGDNRKSLIAHLLQYAEGERSQALQADPSIKYAYDWNLNGIE